MLDLTLKPTLEDVFEALDYCDAALDGAGISPSTRDDVRLVLEELMVNMVHHGNQDPDGNTIRLRVRATGAAVLAELHDNGMPFDPLQAQAPMLSGDCADPEEVGGLGIHLVRAMASELTYRHDGDGNHLQLRFIHPDSMEPSP